MCYTKGDLRTNVFAHTNRIHPLIKQLEIESQTGTQNEVLEQRKKGEN